MNHKDVVTNNLYGSIGSLFLIYQPFAQCSGILNMSAYNHDMLCRELPKTPCSTIVTMVTNTQQHICILGLCYYVVIFVGLSLSLLSLKIIVTISCDHLIT